MYYHFYLLLLSILKETIDWPQKFARDGIHCISLVYFSSFNSCFTLFSSFPTSQQGIRLFVVFSTLAAFNVPFFTALACGGGSWKIEQVPHLQFQQLICRAAQNNFVSCGSCPCLFYFCCSFSPQLYCINFGLLQSLNVGFTALLLLLLLLPCVYVCGEEKCLISSSTECCDIS